MGEHKYNQTAIDAKNGKLPPKQKKLGRRDRDRVLVQEIERITGIDQIRKWLNGGYNG